MEKEKKKYKYFTKTLTCPDGTRKYIRGKTKKELEEKVRIAQAELDKGVNINDNTTFGELTQLWVDLVKRPRLRPQSLKALLSRVNTHLMPLLGPMKVRDIKPLHCVQLMAGKADKAKSMQLLILSDMRAIFNFGVEHRVIAVSPIPPSLKASGAPRKVRIPLTPQECNSLLAQARKRSEDLYTFVALCLYTGLRASEACGLCWDCVNFETGVISVRRQMVKASGGAELTETLKTGTSRRDVPMPPVLAEHLRSIRQSTSSITVLLSRKRADPANGYCYDLKTLDVGRHIFPHLLRHTYATRLVEAGVDIKTAQYLLGHSTPGMLLDVYAHYDLKSRQQNTAAQVSAISFTA